MKEKSIRCSKCLVTLERLKEDGICEYLLKVVNAEGKEEYVCLTCFNSW